MAVGFQWGRKQEIGNLFSGICFYAAMKAFDGESRDQHSVLNCQSLHSLSRTCIVSDCYFDRGLFGKLMSRL